VHGVLLRRYQRPAEAGRNEWMLLVDVAADRHEMHDGENTRAQKILLFGRVVVGIEPHDIRIAAERARQRGADDGVQLAFL